jgi:hypothetical protein
VFGNSTEKQLFIGLCCSVLGVYGHILWQVFLPYLGLKLPYLVPYLLFKQGAKGVVL